MTYMKPVIDPQTTEREAIPIDSASLTDQVWHDLNETIPWEIVAQTIDQLLAEYEDAAIRTFVPIFVRRQARERLRSINCTEIEAKFKVKDPQLFWHFQTINGLAGFELSSPRSKPIWDIYLDTPRQRIRHAGFSCRRRENRNGIEMTLKSLRRSKGPFHQRTEWQVAMTTSRSPAEWPASQVRDRVLQIIGAEPLLPLVRLEQTRIVRQLQSNGQPVAELSLDSVSVANGDHTHTFHELEIELEPTVPKATLAEIVSILRERWQLEDEPLSKFERGLVLLGAES